MQRVACYFTSHTNNLRVKIKASNLHYVQFMFLHQLGIAPIQLQCSCNIAAAPHLQLNKMLSHAQPVLPQPNMQENNIHKHIYALAAHERSAAMLACSCTAAAPHIAIRRQALPFRNSRKNRTWHKFSVFLTNLCLLHPKFTYAASPS